MMNDTVKMMPAQLFDFDGKHKTTTLHAHQGFENKPAAQILTNAVLNAADIITRPPARRINNPAARTAANIASRRTAAKPAVVNMNTPAAGYAALLANMAGRGRTAMPRLKPRRCSVCSFNCSHRAPRYFANPKRR